MGAPEAMTCVEITAPNDLRVFERDVPSPRRGEVLVRVTAAGICGSDVELLAGQRPAEYSRYPIVPGHEWTGTIAMLGEDVDDPAPGTPVIACGIRGCGACARCREGLANLCTTGYRETGFTEPGGWAEYVVVPANLLYPLTIPAGVDPAVAALLEPAACVANALLGASSVLRPGLHATVVGTGTLSLIGVQIIAASSPASLTVIGASPSAVVLAKRWGATDVIAPADAEADGWTGDADLVFEAGARPASARIALAAARRGGTVFLEGIPTGADTGHELPGISQIVLRELTVHGVFGASPSAWERVADMFGAGLLDLGDLVSHRLPLDRVGEAFALLADRPTDLRKVLLVP